MDLNGWQRLWVVVVLIQFIAITIFTLESWPQKKGDPWPPSLTGGTPDDLNAYYRDGTPLPALSTEEQAKVMKLHREKIVQINTYNKHHESRQRTHALTGLFLWVILGISTYLVGWLCAWVIRGFRRSRPR